MKKTLLSSLVAAVLLSGCGGGGGSSSSGGATNTGSNPNLIDTGTFNNGYVDGWPTHICGTQACYVLSSCGSDGHLGASTLFSIYANGTAQTTYTNNNYQTVTDTCSVVQAFKRVYVTADTNISDALWSTTQRYYSTSLKAYFIHSSYVSDAASTLTYIYNNGQNATIQYGNNGGTTNVPLNSIHQEVTLSSIGIIVP